MNQRRLERLSSAVLHDVQATSGGSEPGAIPTVYIDRPVLFGGRASSAQRVGHKCAVSDALQAASTSSPEIPFAILKESVDTSASEIALIGERNARGVDAQKTSRCPGPDVAIVVPQESEDLDACQGRRQVNSGESNAIPSIKSFTDGMAFDSPELTCRRPWQASRSSLSCGTTMATSGPGQREVFCASTPLAFRSPMRAISEAEVSTLSLRIAKGISGLEVDAAWSASETAHL